MEKSEINKFEEEFRFLSNFYPCEVKFRGYIFPSTENAYQFAKIPYNLRNTYVDLFINCPPNIAKKNGRSVKIRNNWENIKVKIMFALLTKKFKNPVLRKKLLDTGNAILIEGNYWNDTFWGVCNNVGKNMLGKLLMKVRKEINDEIKMVWE